MGVARSILETEALLETARGLAPLQRQLLGSLRDKGPGLLLEIAVRTFMFPDEVSQPLQELRDRGLVQTRNFAGGPMGSEIYSLTRRGEQVVDLLRDEAMAGQLEPMQEAPPALARAAAPDPRQQELELLRKLGDLAAQSGEVDRARTYYEQALTITRSFSAPPTS